MDNEIEPMIPEDPIKVRPKASSPAVPQKPAAPKPPVRPQRPKPIVEGINSPKNTQDIVFIKPNLTTQEKELVSATPETQEPKLDFLKSEPRLMPDSVIASVNKKHHHIGRWLLIFVVLLILIAGGYEFYVWKLQNGIVPIVGRFHPAATNIASQPFPLAGGTAPTSSTSTMVSVTSSSTPAGLASPTPTSTAPVTQLKINSTPTGYLKVRSSPSTSATVLTEVHPGEIYTYTQVKNGWYEITYSGFNQGWVSGQYITKQ